MNRISRIAAAALIGVFTTCVDDRPPLTSPAETTSSGAAALLFSSITHTLLTAGTNASNLKVYTTASISPAPNALVTVAVLSRRSSGGPLTPSVSGGGMTTWTQVTSVDFGTIAAPTSRVVVFRALRATPGSGPVTITFSSSVSNATWAVSQWDGVDPSGVNGAGAIVQAGSARGDAVSTLATTLGAFADANDATYAVAAASVNGPAVTPGAGLTEVAEPTSGESTVLEAAWGVNVPAVAATLSSAKNAALVGIEIKAAGGGGGGGGVSAAQSTVSVAPGSIVAGSGSSTITVMVNDATGQPVSGATVVLAATGTGNTLTQPSGVTGSDGKATGTLSSTKAEVKTITATANGTTTIAQQPQISVAAGPVSVSQSTITAAPTSIAPGATSTITVTAKDANGNPISGATVELATTGSGSALTQPADTTNTVGVATGTLISPVEETDVVSAKIGGIAITPTVTVDIARQVDAARSTVTTDVASIAAGSGTATITVTVRDGADQPISGVTVALAATGTGNTLTQPAATTDADGKATGTLSSTVAGSKTVSAKANGKSITQTTPVTVTPGPVSESQSSVVAAPTMIATGTGVATITVTVKDAYGNAIAGAAVQLATNGVGSLLTQPAAPTNASGVATGTLSSPVEETDVVSASVGVIQIVQTATVMVMTQAAADPLACTGYPEPRIFLESQAWWDSAGLVLPTNVGHHTHVGMCWPVNPDGSDALVDGVLHLDVRILLHDQIGVTSYLRFQDASGSAQIKIPLVIGPGDATAWMPVDLDLGLWGTGRRETHITANIPNNADGKRQFNSTGWQLCVRSCTPTYRTPPWTEARGWYEGHDYQNARFLSLLPVAPVSGLWTFRVRLLQTGPGGVFIDPNFHAGIEGTRVAAAGFYGFVTVDTRLLTNGPHRLVLVASDGKSAGVQVIPFTVAN